MTIDRIRNLAGVCALLAVLAVLIPSNAAASTFDPCKASGIGDAGGIKEFDEIVPNPGGKRVDVALLCGPIVTYGWMEKATYDEKVAELLRETDTEFAGHDTHALQAGVGSPFWFWYCYKANPAEVQKNCAGNLESFPYIRGPNVQALILDALESDSVVEEALRDAGIALGSGLGPAIIACAVGGAETGGTACAVAAVSLAVAAVGAFITSALVRLVPSFSEWNVEVMHNAEWFTWADTENLWWDGTGSIGADYVNPRLLNFTFYTHQARVALAISSAPIGQGPSYACVAAGHGIAGFDCPQPPSTPPAEGGAPPSEGGAMAAIVRRLRGSGGGLHAIDPDDFRSNGRGELDPHGEEITRHGGRGHDVLRGGDGNDSLTGRGGDDRLLGRPGDDELAGGGGKDVLRGAAGADALYGGSGHDLLDGGRGADILFGHRGDDVLRGGPGSDRLIDQSQGVEIHGGRGDDFVYTVDRRGERRGSDIVDCGPGRDRAIVSSGDVVRNCERVTRLTLAQVRCLRRTKVSATPQPSRTAPRCLGHRGARGG
jgi:hypothetical protein